MKWKRKEEGVYWVRLERGEEVGASLQLFFEESGVQGGTVVGIGALQDTELGFFDCRSAQYMRRLFPEELELVSFLGNVTLLDGRPFMHAHAILSGTDFVAKAGHFFKGVVAVTMECQIFPIASPVSRKLDEAIGLKLMDLL